MFRPRSQARSAPKTPAPSIAYDASPPRVSEECVVQCEPQRPKASATPLLIGYDASPPRVSEECVVQCEPQRPKASAKALGTVMTPPSASPCQEKNFCGPVRTSARTSQRKG